MGEAKRRAEIAAAEAAHAAHRAVISVLIPERGRPHMLRRLICSLIDTAWDDANYEILVAIDNDDPSWTDIERLPEQDGPTRVFYWDRPITLGEKINELARKAKGDIMWFIANDYVMETFGWPAVFRSAAASLPNGIGIAFPHDDLHPNHAAFPLITRKMWDAVGFCMAPWFPTWFIDTWWDEIGIMMGCHFEIPVLVRAPEGRGKTHGMVDLEFWVSFFNETRQLRVRDAVNLAGIAYETDSQLHTRMMAQIQSRHGLCVDRSAHLSTPAFLARWGSNSASPPSPTYPEVRAYAEKLLNSLTAGKSRKPRVALCVPSGRTWEGSSANAIVALSYYSAQAGIEMIALNVQASAISHGRNSSVKIALDAGADFLMWIDSDMVMPPDSLVRLMAHGKDIVGATYNKRTIPHTTLGLFAGPRPERMMTDGLHEALLLPGGMMLVKADVYRKLGFPHYFEAYRWEAADGLAAFKEMLRSYYTEEPPPEVMDSLDESVFGRWIADHNTLGEQGEAFPYFSEDLSFCRRARRAGFQVWCDVGLSSDMVHLGQINVTCRMPDDARPITTGAPEVHGGFMTEIAQAAE